MRSRLLGRVCWECRADYFSYPAHARQGFVASAATLNAPGDAILGRFFSILQSAVHVTVLFNSRLILLVHSAIRYPNMSTPMPYSSVQIQPMAQLMEPTHDKVRQAQKDLLFLPVN